MEVVLSLLWRFKVWCEIKSYRMRDIRCDSKWLEYTNREPKSRTGTSQSGSFSMSWWMRKTLSMIRVTFFAWSISCVDMQLPSQRQMVHYQTDNSVRIPYVRGPDIQDDHLH